MIFAREVLASRAAASASLATIGTCTGTSKSRLLYSSPIALRFRQSMCPLRCRNFTTPSAHRVIVGAYAGYFGLAQRRFSTSTEPVIDTAGLQNELVERAPAMADGLASKGYYTTTNVLPMDSITTLRSQAVALRRKGRFEQSWSEKIVDGEAVRFDKEGVYACEPDGQDYYDAPDLIVYMSVLLQTLPPALNSQAPTTDMDLSNQSFNAKLAVTSPGGSKYPLHIDNPQGLSVGDTRKLTCILYLNPEYQPKDGGELRIFLSAGDDELETVDLPPEGGRLLMFWSDEIPHEVLATAPDGARDDESLDRYALTVWIPTTNVAAIHNDASKFSTLKDLAFP